MAKWMWILALGGITTFIIFKTQRAFAFIAALATAAATFIAFKQG